MTPEQSHHYARVLGMPIIVSEGPDYSMQLAYKLSLDKALSARDRKLLATAEDELQKINPDTDQQSQQRVSSIVRRLLSRSASHDQP